MEKLSLPTPANSVGKLANSFCGIARQENIRSNVDCVDLLGDTID
jgi:hypothetical protein